MKAMDMEIKKAYQEVFDGEKLNEVIQEIPAERAEKAFAKKDLQKLADRLGDDDDLFAAIMYEQDLDKAYAAATAAVPGDYTKEEFGEFRTVFANIGT